MIWLPSFTWSLPREPVPDHSSHPSPSSFFLIALTTICSLTHLCCGKLISVRSGLDLCCSSLYLPHRRCLTFIFVQWLSRLSLLCDSLWPMVCSTPGSSVLHCLLKFAQIHVHGVNDATYLSHPLPLASPFAFNLTQHPSLFPWVSSWHQGAKVLEFQLQHQSFQWWKGK